MPGTEDAHPFATPTVVVDDVSVRYRTPSSEAAEREQAAHPLARAARALVGRRPSVVVDALTGISLVARAGEQIGLVGRNGSGKSTLLRVVAGLERPSHGQVLAAHQPVLIGTNAALVPDLTGTENARLGCLAMGLTPAETARAVPEILDLAGIGSAVHLPMRTYSAGMGARLRFAIASAVRPHVLLIDEALATGDAAFRARSADRMRELRAEAGTVFLVSHDARTIEETCSRAVWLHEGRVALDGPAGDVAKRYRRWAFWTAKGRPATARSILDEAVAERVDPPPLARTAAAPPAPPRHARPRVARPSRTGTQVGA
jgi:teichoic acid transport system ATP-binding protein